MLTFDEFFKKKRIDLFALEQGEPALFLDFKTHYGQMGEKSFDHTKKYWFNKIRRQFPLAPEIKAEKAPVENQLAEQTITESLIETVASPPPAKLGSVPKFKAGVTKPSIPVDEKEELSVTQTNAQSAPITQPTKLGFVPKFKAGVTKPAFGSEINKEERPAAEEPTKPKPSEESAEAKPAYKPRFNMKNIPPKATDE